MHLRHLKPMVLLVFGEMQLKEDLELLQELDLQKSMETITHLQLSKLMDLYMYGEHLGAEVMDDQRVLDL